VQKEQLVKDPVRRVAIVKLAIILVIFALEISTLVVVARFS